MAAGRIWADASAQGRRRRGRSGSPSARTATNGVENGIELLISKTLSSANGSCARRHRAGQSQDRTRRKAHARPVWAAGAFSR